MSQAANEAFCLVMTTLPTEAQAEDMARALVRARLAACVQVQAIRSFYVWREEAHADPEWLLLIKTRVARYAELERHLLERHPYATPEIVQVPISAGSAGYLAWVEAMTRPD